jgi:hypothetical protein
VDDVKYRVFVCIACSYVSLNKHERGKCGVVMNEDPDG